MSETLDSLLDTLAAYPETEDAACFTLRLTGLTQAYTTQT